MLKLRHLSLAIAAAILMTTLAGCGVYEKFAQPDRSSAQSAVTVIPDIVIDSTPLVDSTPSVEEERTHFDSVWDMFDYKKDKSEIPFMSIETDSGVQQMFIPSFEEQLKRYGKGAKVQSDGGLYAFDSAGATIAIVPNDDGSTDYQLCDGGVLGASMENKYMQVIKSGSSCFGMHLGTSTMFLELQIPGIEQVESDIGNAGKFVLERDDYCLTVYTNAGECFWFIVTVF